ncbi:MAG TPA: hypothetical protein VF160_08595 [Candidatus Dormibacteraeota bacterium]
MSIEPEDLARTALVRMIRGRRYRLAGPTDARFSDIMANAFRVAYRQQGAEPSLLIFSGPGHDPEAAGRAAAEWAAANWRPNAVQRKVRPGVVVVQVAPGSQLKPAGALQGVPVTAAIWAVDSASGRTQTAGRPSGAPPARELKRAAAALMNGLPAPSLGELDLAEREVMRLRTVRIAPLVTGCLAISLVFYGLRYGLTAFSGVFTWSALLSSGGSAAVGVSPGVALGGLAADVLLLAGIGLGLGVLLNVRGLAFAAPGFSSPSPRVRTATWVGYGAVMVALALVLQMALPDVVARQNRSAAHAEGMHVTATTDDDGSEAAVLLGGDLTVDLSSWPAAEWQGVEFRSSNPAVLEMQPAAPWTKAPTALFDAVGVGTARVDATSADGRFTFELRVSVIRG